MRGLIGLMGLSLLACTEPPLVSPAIIGSFSGTLYNTDSSDQALRLEAQLIDATPDRYRFEGILDIADRTYVLEGQEIAQGVRYQSSPPQGRIVATLSQNGVQFCLELWAKYLGGQVPTALGGQLKQTSQTSLESCEGRFVGSVDLSRQP